MITSTGTWYVVIYSCQNVPSEIRPTPVRCTRITDNIVASSLVRSCSRTSRSGNHARSSTLNPFTEGELVVKRQAKTR